MRILRATQPKKRKGFKSIQNTRTGPPPIAACVAHRCARHENVRPLNLNTSERTECAACVSEDIQNVMVIYHNMRDTLDRACNALDLLSPGAGDAYRPPQEEDLDEHTENASHPDQEAPPVRTDGGGTDGEGH